MAFRKTTIYADLRPSDLVIDKSGQAWPLDAISSSEDGTTIFWLCDPVSKARAHLISKQSGDAVNVSRLPTQADEASKLEAEMPVVVPPGTVTGISTDANYVSLAEAVAAVEEIGGTVEAEFPADADPNGRTPDDDMTDAIDFGDNFATMAAALRETAWTAESVEAGAARIRDEIGVTMAEAVAAVEEIGGTVEAEVTPAEVDAAAAATDDAPLTIIPFADMTPLEARSHLYLLHGVYGHDLQGKAELDRLHADAHFRHIEGTLNSRHVPHTHE